VDNRTYFDWDRSCPLSGVGNFPLLLGYYHLAPEARGDVYRGRLAIPFLQFTPTLEKLGGRIKSA